MGLVTNGSLHCFAVNPRIIITIDGGGRAVADYQMVLMSVQSGHQSRCARSGVVERGRKSRLKSQVQVSGIHPCFNRLARQVWS